MSRALLWKGLLITVIVAVFAWSAYPLGEELNLGLDSFIFVDDSDYECAAVRHALPEVEVIQVPSKPTEVPYCLDRVARLEILSLTAEDQSKTENQSHE